MRITFLTQLQWHPFEARLAEWIDTLHPRHEISRCSDINSLEGGDILFILSFHALVREPRRRLYGRAYVIHASALPRGRGWSPLEWQVVEGEREITVSLILAEDEIDSGDVCAQTTCSIPDHALRSEIENMLFEAEIELMSRALDAESALTPRPQSGTPSVYRRRTPEDSRLDVTRSIEDQFDVMRVADPVRFPAFFEMRGHRYVVRLEKVEDQL